MRQIAIGMVWVLAATSSAALDVETVFLGVVEDREQDASLLYAFVATVNGEDVAGGRVYRPGNPTPICSLDPSGGVFLDGDATCNIIGSSIADFCNQFGFGDFILEIDAAPGGTDDTVTLFFDPGCVDPFPGNADVVAPTAGAIVPPIPAPGSFCFDCTVPGGCAEAWQMELFDDFGDVGTAELYRPDSVPGCWEPGICLSSQSEYSYRVSSIELYEAGASRSTDLGDEFSLFAFYQNANLELFDVTAGAPTTPSAIPAGEGGSIPVFAEKLDAAGTSLDVYWDDFSCCGNAETHLVFGTRADLPASLGGSFAVDGSLCALGTEAPVSWNAVPAVAAGDFLWWLVVSSDGASTEGSWGLDSVGQERLGPFECGMTARDTANACGR